VPLLLQARTTLYLVCPFPCQGKTLELQGWTVYSAKLSDCLLAELVAEVQQTANLSTSLLTEVAGY
jgi:hypothetical protein